MTDPKPLTRDELAKFLPNQRAIRAFEKLFDLIPDDLESLTVLIQESSLDASIANARAQQAIDLLARLVTAVEMLALAPQISISAPGDVYLPVIPEVIAQDDVAPIPPYQ